MVDTAIQCCIYLLFFFDKNPVAEDSNNNSETRTNARRSQFTATQYNNAAGAPGSANLSKCGRRTPLDASIIIIFYYLSRRE